MTSEHNDTYYQTSEQRPIRNEFDSKRIVKRDFWLIPTYLVMNIVFPLILTFIVMGIISASQVVIYRKVSLQNII